MSNLAIDIGNTRIKYGLFEDQDLVQQGFLEKKTAIAGIQALTTNLIVKNVIYSNVGKLDSALMSYLDQQLKGLALSHKTPLPIKNFYETPETLGRDRIAAVMGAYHLFPQTNCLVIDAGTCMTLDLLTARGEYLGGNISPGIQMRLKAMHEFTAQLPKVQSSDFENYLGKSTEEAIQNGAILGALLEIKAFIQWARRKFRGLEVLITGGDAFFFAKHLKRKIFVDSNLVLIGLNKILEHNAEPKA